VPGVGVDSHDAGDPALDPGLLEGLATAAWATDLPRSTAPPGRAQLLLSVQRISRIAPASLTTTTLTEGTRLLALGASGSRSSRSSVGSSAHPFEKGGDAFRPKEALLRGLPRHKSYVRAE
jgi:hypothetical protein